MRTNCFVMSAFWATTAAALAACGASPSAGPQDTGVVPAADGGAPDGTATVVGSPGDAGAPRSSISVAATVADSGTLGAGVVAATTLTVSNDSTEPVGTPDLQVVGLTGANLILQDSSCNAPLEPGFSCYVNALFSGEKLGLQSFEVTATSTLGGTGSVKLSVNIVSDATLQMDQSAAAFGSVPYQQASAPVVMHVTNTGGVETGPLQIHFSGANARDFSETDACGALAAGGSCDISVMLTPSALGAIAGTLSVSASPGGRLTAALSGTGMQSYSNLGDKAQWSTFDMTTVNANAKGFAGGAFDGRFIYFVPENNSPGFAGNGYDGVVSRYDTQAGFASASAWVTFDVSTVNPAAVGFFGAAFDGRYVYFVPRAGLTVTRYDTQAATTQGAAFTEAAAWSTFDLRTTNGDAKEFAGATFDGRYLYLAPTNTNSNIARYDTQAPFGSASSWSTFDTATVGANRGYFFGTAYDGRHVYLLPAGKGYGEGGGAIFSYDTQSNFGAAASWSTFDSGRGRRRKRGLRWGGV